MTAGEAGVELAAAPALPDGWLEKRQCVDMCQLVLIVEVSPFAGSS